MKAIVRIVIIIAALSSGYVNAQDKAAFAPTNSGSVPAETKAPELTSEQKQAIKILALTLENAQLKAQAAQTDFDRARAEITKLVQSLQKDGYDLDLQTFAYTPKKPDPAKK